MLKDSAASFVSNQRGTQGKCQSENQNRNVHFGKPADAQLRQINILNQVKNKNKYRGRAQKSLQIFCAVLTQQIIIEHRGGDYERRENRPRITRKQYQTEGEADNKI